MQRSEGTVSLAEGNSKAEAQGRNKYADYELGRPTWMK